MGPTGESPDDRAIDQFLRIAPRVPMAVAGWESGAFVNANPAMADLLGVSAERLTGRTMAEFEAVADQHAFFLQQVERAGEAGAEAEIELQRSGGQRIWARISGRRISYRGAPALLAIMQDITAQKEQERQLAETQERLARQSTDLTSNELRIKQRAAEAANRAKSLFLTHMSHELRSPLNSILGFAELIRDLHYGPEQVKKYVEYGNYIHQAGTHLLALINDILDLAKVESGKLKLQQSRFELAELLNECARMVRPMAEQAGLGLETSVEPGITLTADRLRAKQMVINLLSNATKFTPAGGRIALAGQLVPGEAITITVMDTGGGMTPAELALALEPFGRTETGVAKDPTGTGLGLPIVRNLIEAHGGRLEIHSERGRGTTARLFFPVTAAAR